MKKTGIPTNTSSVPESSEIWLPRLIRLLDDQLADADRLSVLSRRQAELAAAGEVEEVVAVIDERQPVVDALAARSTELGPFARDLEGFLRVVAPRYRELIREKVTRLEGIVGIINQQDEIDKATLERTRDRLAQEIAGFGRGRAAVSAYGRESRDAGDNPPVYQDRQG